MSLEEQKEDDIRTQKNGLNLKKCVTTGILVVTILSNSSKPANGVLPGAEGFSISTPHPKKYGRLPIRRNTLPTTHGVGELVPQRFGGRVDRVRRQAARNDNNQAKTLKTKSL